MKLGNSSHGRIVGLVALASTALGLPLSLVPQERPVLYPFETLDKGLYSGFGSHCSAGFIGDAAVGRSLTNLAARAQVLPPREPPGPCYVDVATPAFEAVFRNECAWLDFWREHTWDSTQDPVLFVDFSRYVVVAVIEGPGGGCNDFHIEGISRGPGDTRRIHVRKAIDCLGRTCHVLSNAYHFILVPAEFVPRDAAIAFVHDEEVPEGILMKARRPGTSVEPR